MSMFNNFKQYLRSIVKLNFNKNQRLFYSSINNQRLFSSNIINTNATFDNIISASQFNKSSLLEIFDIANYLKKNISLGQNNINILDNKILHSLFYEPSTRTRVSFETAMIRLGGSVVSLGGGGINIGSKNNSIEESESLADTIKTLSCYSDCIIIRHTDIGSSLEASKYSNGIPIINAGDSETGEHPTQAIVDCYTINKQIQRLDNITITILGNNNYGKINSLIILLKLFNNITINYISSTNELNQNLLNSTNILYITTNEYINIIQSQSLPKSKNFLILHPLSTTSKQFYNEFDIMNRDITFKQIQDGLYIRMAILLKTIKH